jgi:3-methyladenine DNA glycosylase/8-oxoguanine DNA glycosylase
MRIDRAETLRASRTPAGPATLHLRVSGTHVDAEAWGAGAEWALEHAPDLLGGNDDRTSLVTRNRLVSDLHRRTPGLRLCRSGTIIDVLVPTILEQKITSQEARRSFQRLVRCYGEPAPGPGNLKLQPSPDRLARLPYWAFHPLGIARTRAETIRRACALAPRLEEAATMDPLAAAQRLRSVTGIGPWTVGHVTAAALGDPDAVIVGDFHLPHTVTWVLAGEPRGSDERMLELLSEFPGQRGRVMRLIASAGIRPPATTNRRRIHHIEAH